MKRLVVTVLLSIAVVGGVSVQVDAQRRGRARQAANRAPREEAAPHSAAISDAMGELRWGMTPDEVRQHFIKQIREKYRPLVAKARDAIAEDRLRHEERESLARLREDYVQFTGDTTGWEASFIRDEFTHHNEESMLLVRDGNSQNFYFFIRGRLWKWYKAFDADVFAGQGFEQFAGALQARYGEARERTGKLREQGDEKHWLEWQDETTRLRAIDENRFYGFYCLVFEEKATVARLAELRTNAPTARRGGHAIVDSILEDQEAAEGSTPRGGNADIVDRLTGKLRRRPEPVEDAGIKGTTKRR